MLLILFGLSGSGKNFVGEIFANNFNYHFWDADTILPDPMLECIKNRASFTQEMRDNFTNDIIQHVIQLQTHHTNLVVAQAFYKESNRRQLVDALPNAKLIQIKAEPAIIAARLQKNKTTDHLYAEKIRPNFEETKLPHLIINNNSDADAVITQLKNTL